MYRMPAPPRAAPPELRRDPINTNLPRPGKNHPLASEPDADFYRDMITQFFQGRGDITPQEEYGQKGPQGPWEGSTDMQALKHAHTNGLFPVIISIEGHEMARGKDFKKEQARQIAWVEAGVKLERKYGEWTETYKRTRRLREAKEMIIQKKADVKEVAPQMDLMDEPGVRTVRPDRARIGRTNASPFVATGGYRGRAGAAGEDDRIQDIDINPNSIWQPFQFKLSSSFSTAVGSFLDKINQAKPYHKSVDLRDPPRHKRTAPKPDEIAARDNTLHNKHASSIQKRWIRLTRPAPPVMKHISKIINCLEVGDILLLSSPPGCGKSTQLPLLIFETAILKRQGAGCSILVVHPRRVTAVTCAEFAARQLGEGVGGDVVRFWEVPGDRVPEQGGFVTYVTAATLVEAFGQDGRVADVLEGVSCVIVDEVQEADTASYLVIGMVKRQMKKQPQLKMIVSTASAQHVEDLTKWLDDQLSEATVTAGSARPIKFRSFALEKELFPVQHRFGTDTIRELEEMLADDCEPPPELVSGETQHFGKREREFSKSHGQVTNGVNGVTHGRDNDDDVPFDLMSLVVAHVARVSEEGAILVLLPDIASISRLRAKLLNHQPLGMDFSDKSFCRILCLHPGMPSIPDDFFVASDGDIRHIFLATSIAEANVVVADVGYVLDAGKVVVPEWDATLRTTVMKTRWESQSQVMERMNQAGQRREGLYIGFFHRSRVATFAPLPPSPFENTNAVEICLRIKALYPEQNLVRMAEILLGGQLSEDEVKKALDTLQSLQAISCTLGPAHTIGIHTETIRPLGRMMAKFPCFPEIAKVLIYAVVFRCLDPVLTIVAVGSCQRSLFDPLARAEDVQRMRLRFAEGVQSDHMVWLRAFDEWRTIKQNNLSDKDLDAQCKNAHLNPRAFEEVEQIRRHFAHILLSVGCLSTIPSNGYDIIGTEDGRNQMSCELELVRALLCTGSWSNLAQRTRTGALAATDDEQTVLPHPSHSVMGTNGLPPTGTFYTFQKRHAEPHRSVYLSGCTRVTPVAVVMFGSGKKEIFKEGATDRGFRTITFSIDDRVTLVGHEVPPAKGDLRRIYAVRGIVGRMVDAWVTRFEGFGRVRGGVEQVQKEALWEGEVLKAVAEYCREAEEGEN
ncbi:hypothetical protein HK097_010849 [Rhizophlyctis rosea]|uniref:Helicase ATP-binding domain-containing protein n=1 Tax=Rhizophlyctis rosea TaxID=64517 RepID=A0AAD5SAC0_9FUNG|nr:hypothetical protein HK097_010849 [Rhizophlyctis rosea]